MVIALSDHPQAQLCPAWQRQGQAPSHHLHTALEWGQCPPQRGWEKPLSWGHLLGDRGLSEPTSHCPAREGTRGSTALGQVGDLLSAQKRAVFPVFLKLGRFLAVLSLTLCLFFICFACLHPSPVPCMALHVAEATTPHGTQCLAVALPCRLSVPGDRVTVATSIAELLMAGRQGTGVAGRQAACCKRVTPGCPHCPPCPLMGGGCTLAPGTMQGGGMDDEDSCANSWGTAWQQC